MVSINIKEGESFEKALRRFKKLVIENNLPQIVLVDEENKILPESIEEYVLI